MSYFVTGATGLIGRHLVERLLEREGTIHVLVREGSHERLERLRNSLGPDGERVIPVTGDLLSPMLGVPAAVRKELRGCDFFHVAALYDMAASEKSLAAANIDGTVNALELAEDVEARVFHHVSSIAVAGSYAGTFREDMLEEAADVLNNPYFRTKHESERRVRSDCARPWRIYRPGAVVGHSETGEMDKIDGPYYAFKLIQKLSGVLPSWLPLPGFDGGPAHIVPVDFVAAAIDHIAHQDGLDGRAFHLVDPEGASAGDAIDAISRAARGPRFTKRLESGIPLKVPEVLSTHRPEFPRIRRRMERTLESLGIPGRVLSISRLPELDCREATRALEGSGIAVPPLESYAGKLWDYWECHMDPDRFSDPRLAASVAGKRVLVTGASAGIGRSTALRVGAAGGTVLLVARSADKLAEVKAEIERAGGTAFLHTADLSDPASCDALVEEVNAQHGGVDVLVNNAGRSIRRSVNRSFDRFHDFERTMQLNYFGSMKLILGFLPGMQERQDGQILNVSSLGCQASPPRFSAYVASKAALDGFTGCAAPEFLEDGIAFTTVYMPLVRTEMIAPTEVYQRFPTISPDEAAETITDAIVKRPRRVASKVGFFAQTMRAIAPKTSDAIYGLGWRLLPDSAAAKGQRALRPV